MTAADYEQMEPAPRRIGQGNVTSGAGCSGTVRVADEVADVLRLMQLDLTDAVLLTHSASATAVTPLFPRLRGVMCTTGGATSHLAIVAREFNLPCLMGAQFAEPSIDLDGRALSFDAHGGIFLQS